MSFRKNTKRGNVDKTLNLSTKKPKVAIDLEEEAESPTPCDTGIISIADQILSLENNLCNHLQKITFRWPIEYIYNPLEYASNVHTIYVQKYCNGLKKILFLGINPGPWGMSQTGVPFGEINAVKNWLKISGLVGKPAKEHPNRKITGFECTRSEISGKRFWGLFEDLCKHPQKFFQHAYMHNYCPLALMDGGARNITPAELKGEAQKTLHTLCDQALLDIIQLLKCEIVIGIGKYAEKRAEVALQASNLSVKVLSIPHPSPRAVNNENWNEKAVKKLDELGLLNLFKE